MQQENKACGAVRSVKRGRDQLSRDNLEGSNEGLVIGGADCGHLNKEPRI